MNKSKNYLSTAIVCVLLAGGLAGATRVQAADACGQTAQHFRDGNQIIQLCVKCRAEFGGRGGFLRP